MRRMRPRSTLMLFVTLAAAVTGCASAPTKSFDITVHNRTELPGTIWLTKDGPPKERGWYTLDQFLKMPENETSPGVRVPPGKRANTGKVTGKFPQGTNPVLLVYRSGETANAPGRSEPLTVQL